MSMKTLREGPDAPLAAILEARERRVARRGAALAGRQGAAAVTVTVVMPGPVKDCGLSRLVHAAALESLDRLWAEQGWQADAAVRETPLTGPEAMFVIAADATVLKRALIDLEEHHPLGRLWDIDVAAPDGQAVSRGSLGLPPRRCLVCGRPAHLCARSRAHPLEDLLKAMERRVNAWIFHPQPALALEGYCAPHH
ncbi:MAG: citrate lyase holo-[acyl-carrier protein] synthase [Rhodospirillaceae bacterium]